jgi:hypothetical protein
MQLLDQIALQDEGWYGMNVLLDGGGGTPVDSDTAVGYLLHPAGMLTLIAHPEREDRGSIAVHCAFSFMSCPARFAGGRGWASGPPGTPEPVPFRPWPGPPAGP